MAPPNRSIAPGRDSNYLLLVEKKAEDSYPSIRFLYFDGCPNAQSTLSNLRSVLASIDQQITVDIVEVDPEAFAEPFEGSPSILVNGVDLYSQQTPSSHQFACRVFDLGGKQTGELSEEFIRKRLDDMIR